MSHANANADGVLERLRNRTWRGARSSLDWDDARGEYVTREGGRPPEWLGQAELVEDLHAQRRQIGGPQALTVAVFRIERRGLRGERRPELRAVMAAGDPKRPTWLEAYIGEEVS